MTQSKVLIGCWHHHPGCCPSRDSLDHGKADKVCFDYSTLLNPSPRSVPALGFLRPFSSLARLRGHVQVLEFPLGYLKQSKGKLRATQKL